MQTDIWLTQSAQPTQCPLCSKPLKASSKTCYACGFSLESPTSRNTSAGSSVWIDPAVYTYQPPESAPDAQPSERSKILPNTPKSAKPTGSVVWEGNEQAQGPHPSTQPPPVPTSQSQPQTRPRTGSISSTGRHTSPISKSVAKPVHTRRRTYTRSLSQTQDGNPSARPPAPQPPMWQYESPNFEAGSSLPSLSLLVAETPTQPGITFPEEEAILMSDAVSAAEHTEDAQPSSETVGRADQSAMGAINRPLRSSTSYAGTNNSDGSVTAQTINRPLRSSTSYAHVDEIDTVPEQGGMQFVAPQDMIERSTRDAFQSLAAASLAHVDEIDTVPTLDVMEESAFQSLAATSLADLDQIDTLPERIVRRSAEQASSRALIPVTPQAATISATDSSSWTAGSGAQSSYARRITDRTRPKKRRSGLSLNPFDPVRWWLLRPGRIEFILWLGGTILLISVTCVLLLVTAFSLNWITPGLRSSVTSSSSNVTNTAPQGHVLPTITSTPGLVFTLLDKDHFFLPGQSIHVHGQGFTPGGKIVFTLDGPQIPLNPNGSSVQADVHGEFTATLSLGYGPALTPGLHLIIAHDIKTDSLAVLSFTIAQGDIGKGATATPVHVTPGVTVTPTPSKSGGGGNPTPTPVTTPAPAGGTPAPTITPTVGTSPTPVPTKPPTPTPTPDPTVGVTPTPTPGTTPTPSSSPTAAVPPAPSPTTAASPTAAVPLSSTFSGDSGSGGGLSNALGSSNTPALNAALTQLAPWLWLPMLFYTLSMLMLGLAGVLHKRRR